MTELTHTAEELGQVSQRAYNWLTAIKHPTPLRELQMLLEALAQPKSLVNKLSSYLAGDALVAPRLSGPIHSHHRQLQTLAWEIIKDWQASSLLVMKRKKETPEDIDNSYCFVRMPGETLELVENRATSYWLKMVRVEQA